jgi:hypothetical protein
MINTGNATMTCNGVTGALSAYPTSKQASCIGPPVLPQGMINGFTCDGPADHVFIPGSLCWPTIDPCWTVASGNPVYKCDAGQWVTYGAAPTTLRAEYGGAQFVDVNVVTEFSAYLNPAPMVWGSSATEIFWANWLWDGKLLRVNLTTGRNTMIVPTNHNGIFDTVGGLTYDATNKRLWVVNGNGGGLLYWINMDPAAGANYLLLTGPINSGFAVKASGMVADTVSGKLWYADTDDKKMYSITPTVGSARTQLGTTVFSAPAGLVRFGANLYLSDCAAGAIFRIVISTGASARIDTGSVLLCPSQIAIDNAGAFIYIVDTTRLNVYKMAIAGGAPTQVNKGYLGVQVNGITVDPTGDYLYVGSRVEFGSEGWENKVRMLRIDLRATGCKASCLQSQLLPAPGFDTSVGGGGQAYGTCPTSGVVAYGATACTLSCATGFTSGSSGLPACSSSSRTWITTTKTCNPNPCAGSTVPITGNNATRGDCPSGATTIDSMAACQLECAAGYDRTAGGELLCWATTWSGAQPTC